MIHAFNQRGGRVAYGTDDNYIWATPGFSNVRELQLMRETGLHTLEVLKAATYNSAQTLRRPKLGLVRPGYLAGRMIGRVEQEITSFNESGWAPYQGPLQLIDCLLGRRVRTHEAG